MERRLASLVMAANCVTADQRSESGLRSEKLTSG